MSVIERMIKNQLKDYKPSGLFDSQLDAAEVCTLGRDPPPKENNQGAVLFEGMPFHCLDEKGSTPQLSDALDDLDLVGNGGPKLRHSRLQSEQVSSYIMSICFLCHKSYILTQRLFI